MSGFVDNVLNVDPLLALFIVGLLVFAEDALFVGFIDPGETAAVLGGVVASRGGLSPVVRDRRGGAGRNHRGLSRIRGR